ncbi:MAG: T9SS type A sorting domain-containing protein [Ignavibacteria bacterium]
MPQLYRYDYSSYLYELNLALSYVPLSKLHIFFPAALMKIGNWLITPDYLFNVIQVNRQKNVRGESWFFYEGLRANNNFLGDTLKSTYYSQKAQLPYRNGNIWRPKGISSDDTSSSTVKVGKWISFPVGGHSSGFSMSNDTSYASIEYYVDVPYDAFYHLYVYIVTNTVNTTKAKYTIYLQNDSTILLVNQMSAANSGWYKLGDFYLTKGNQRILKLDNSESERGKYLTSDAVLLLLNRKLSPNLIITDVETDASLKNDKEISQRILVYPNPFNSKTKINFTISKLDFEHEHHLTTLKIFDALGREVEVLFNNYLKAGKYEIEFDAERLNLSTGIYFGQLVIGKNVRSFKLLYLK